MAKQQLHEFYNRELNEIKQNKTRFGFITASLIISLALFFLTNEDTESKNISDNEIPKVVSAAKEKVPNYNKTAEKSSKLTTITGLKKAAEDVELINPFKVDSKQPSNDTAKLSKPAPAIPIFEPPQPIKSSEPKEKIILILKGTAISGNKKMAIIQRSVKSKGNSSKSKDEKTNIKSLLLNLGDEIDGKRIIDIGKNFIVFDDGQYLYVQEEYQQ